MMKTFPSISTTTRILIENLCIGESYYIKTEDLLSHGRIEESNEYCVRVVNQRAILGTTLTSTASYLKTDHEFDTLESKHNPNSQNEMDPLTQEQVGLNVCFAISPHNETIAIGLTTNIVTIWKVVSGDYVATLGEHCSHHTISCICYSPNGKYIVAGSTDGHMYIWDNVSKQLLHKVHTIADFISGLKFNIDNDLIIIHSVTRHCAHVWSMSKGDFIYSLSINKYTPTQLRNDPCDPMKNLFSENIYMDAVTFSPDGTIIAVVSTINVNTSVVALWRRVRNEERFILINIRDHEDYYSTLSFSPSGKELMLCGESGTITILNADDLSVVRIIGEPVRMHSAIYSPSGEYIVTCGALRNVRVLNAHTMELVADYTGDILEDYGEDFEEDFDGAVSAEFSADETKLVICFPFYIREIPWKTPVFIPDEFKPQLVADGVSVGRDLPDNAKHAICEFLYGVAVAY